MILNLPEVIAFAMLPEQLSAGNSFIVRCLHKITCWWGKIPIVQQYVRVDHTVNMTVLVSV